MNPRPAAKFFLSLALAAFSFGARFDASAQPVDIASWEFAGLANFGASPLAPTTSNANVTVVGLTRGAGVSATGSAAANAWGGTSWLGQADFNAAVTAGSTVSFSVSANTGFSLSLSAVSAYNIRRSSSGPTTGQWQYRVGGGEFVNIGTPTTWGAVTTGTGNPQAAIDLSSIAALQNIAPGSVVDFRIVNYGASGTGTWYLNNLATAGPDFVITGTVGSASPDAPTIASFSPASGTTGSTVTLTGANFTGATAVAFNALAAASFSVVNATTITAVVPAGARTGRITVTTPNGTATSSTDFIPLDGSGAVALQNGGAGSFSGRNLFGRSLSGQTVRLVYTPPSSGTVEGLRVTVPPEFGTPLQANVSVTGTGSAGAVVAVSGQVITVAGLSASSPNAINIDVSGLSTPDTSTPITNNGRYAFSVESRGSGGTFAALSAQPSASVLIPLANARNADPTTFVPVLLNQLIAVEGVCVAGRLGSGATSTMLQDGNLGIALYSLSAVTGPQTRGNRYAAVGTVAQFNGVVQVVLSDPALLVDMGAATEPAPTTVSATEFNNNGVAYQSRVIRIENLSFVSGTWAVNQNVVLQDPSANQVTIRIQQNSTAITAPAFPVTITGIGGQFDNASPFNTGFQLQPRDPADLTSATLPSISVNPPSLTNLTATQGSFGPSTNFVVNASNLTNNITVSANDPINFAISSDNSIFTNTLTLVTNASGAVTNASVFVRLTGAAPAGAKSSTVSLVSGVTSNSVSVSGTVTAAPSSSLTVTGTLTNFSTVQGVASAPQSFVVQGSGLAADVTVSAPANLQFTTNTNSSYSASLVLPIGGGGALNNTVFARIADTAAIGGPTTNVITASSGATNVTLNAISTVSSNTSPFIVVAPTSLSGFSTTEGTPSTNLQTFTVGGTNLTGNLNVAAPAGYQISTNGIDFVSSLALAPVGGVPVVTNIASDNANNYAGGWTNGANGGAGFGAWTITSSNGTGGFGGVFIGNPTFGGITTNATFGTNAFGMFANPGASGAFANADRTFGALQAGQTFSFQWAINWDSDVGNKGFSLFSGGTTGTQLLNVNQGGFPGDIRFIGGGVTNTNIGLAFGTGPMTWSFAMTSSNNLLVTSSPRDGTTGVAFSTNIAVTAGPDSFRWYASAMGGGDQRQQYYNNLRIDGVTVSGDVAPTLVYVRLAGRTAGNVAGNIDLTSPGAAPKIVALTGTVLPRPIITTTASLSPFAADLGSNSAAQPFTFTGTDLVGDVTVSAPSGYEISKTTNGVFANTLTYAVAEAQPGPATNWVRLATNAPPGIVAGNIALASQGAVTTNVAVTGRVTGNPVIALSPTNLTNFFAASGTNSDAQTFVVRGVDLDGPIVLTATNANSWEIRDPADGVYKTSVTLAASNAVPVTFARDSASNAAYAGGWTNNSDGGNGFGPWVIQAAGSATATIGNPAGAAITGMSSNSFALQGTNSYVTAQRRLDTPLLPGDTLSLQFGNNFDSGGPGNKGVNIFAGGFDPANQLLNINMGNSATITINGQPMFAQYGTAAVTLNFQYVAPGQLRVFGTGRNGTETFDQTFAVAAAPDGLSLYAGDLAADQVAQRVLYANDFAITSGSVGPAVDPTEILVRIKTGAPINPALTGSVDATSTGAAPAAVALSGIVSSTPEITHTSSLASFGALVGFPSDPQTFAVGGNNLDAAGVLVTPPAGYEVSLDGIAWSPTVTVPRTGLVTPQRNVSIRIAAAGSAGPRDGNIALTSTGAPNVTIPVTGQVSANPGPQLQAAPPSLSGLTATQGTAGTAQNFALSGQGITQPVNLTAPSGFEISIDGGTSFGPSPTYTPPPSGSFSQTVAVRLTAAAPVGIYSGNLAVSSGGTATSIALSGAVFSGAGAGIIVNPQDLFGFETREGTASDSQSFIAVGRNLVGNVTVSVTNEYFDITTNPADPGSWGDEVVLVPSGGVLPATVIHVRIGAVSAFGNVSGAVSLRDTSGSLANVVVSGFIERLQPPNVRMVKPDQNAPFTRIDPGVPYELVATASATATDGNGNPVAIAQVEFLVDGVTIGTDTTKPYVLPYTFVFEGDYDVTARATDVLGNTALSGVAAVEVRAPLPGELIESFVPPAANGSVRALAGDSTGRVYLGGEFTELTSADEKVFPEPRLARLTATGAVDTTFKTGAGPNARVRSILVVEDGVIFGGDFTQVNGVSRVALAKVAFGGGVDTNFNASIAASATANPFYVQAMVRQPDGKILIGGSFATVGGVARANLARLNANGSLDTGFSPPVNGVVHSIALQADGKILIGGSFTAVHGVTSRRIARLNADGSRDATFNVGTGSSSGFNATVQSVAVTPSGRIYVAGEFTGYKGNTWWRYLAQLDPLGNIVSPFNYLQGLDFPASRVLPVPGTEDALVAGQFTSASNSSLWDGAEPAGRITQFQSDGFLSADFNPGLPGANGAVNDAVLLPGGKWLIAGNFTLFNDVPRAGLALLAGPAVDTTYAGWAAKWGLGGAEAAPAAKLNSAGVPNLLVYALSGEDPRAATQRLSPVGKSAGPVVSSSGLSLLLPRNPDATGVNLSGEYSEDLRTWTTNGVVTEFLPDNTIRLQAPAPSAQNGRQFLRLKVLLP